MKRFSLLVLIIGLLAGVSAASAQVIIPPPCPLDMPCRGVFTDPTWLTIDYHRVTVDIRDQIATTQVEMQFTNTGDALAEGTFIFPLPEGATVSRLTMWVDGQRIEAKILEASEARAIYDAIVRQYRDPALLEYIDSSTIQANVFPIPPGDSRRIEISYAQVLEVDNGLIHYIYPMHRAINSQRTIRDMSIAVNVSGRDPISSVYSPSHRIAVNRAQDTDTAFRAGFEARNFKPDADFSLFYGIARDTINLNLLSYRESAGEDGFFMLLVQPPVSPPAEQIIPRDVIVVLDQSGSMNYDDKWPQARDATAYVLQNLNPDDRFNLILFSTGWRIYSDRMEPAREAADAARWVRGQEAAGGTDINGALMTALDMVGERPTTIVFLTDGLATEGVTATADILRNLQAAPDNVRIFTFGVGNDVDTFLLDSIVRDHRGAGAYVRPGERIDEKVASLYSKINAPVLTDVTLDFGGARIDWLYPQAMPDLFAGEQLTLVGRYRQPADNLTITLRGKIGSSQQTFVYDGLALRARAGGEPFIAQLWATRRIGDLLNSIRLNGESDELVQSVVQLSLRYGIITPYTSFLIEEDDILTQQGRDRAVQQFGQQAQTLAREFTGAGAVAAADAAASLQSAEAPMPQATQIALAAPRDEGVALGGAPGQRSINPIQTVQGKTFIMQDMVWTDTTYDPDTMQPQEVEFLSDAYFELLEQKPELAPYFAQGEQVIVVLDGVAYAVTTG